MKYLSFFLLIITLQTTAEVKWDIPISEFSKYTDDIYLMDLKVGDETTINEYSLFCTTENGNLALNGLTVVGDGDYKVKVVPGGFLELTVPSPKKFLSYLITGDSYAQCSWWTPDKGENLIIISTVNEKESLAELVN